MMAQHPYLLSRATHMPPKRGPKPANGVNDISTPSKRGVYFEESAAKAHKDNQHDDIRRTIANTEGRDGTDGDHVYRGKPWNTLESGSLSRPSLETRLCQHVEKFVNVIGGPMAEGRHLLQLLQLEFRDVVRRSEEAEAEAACLRDRVRHVESCRREKDAADRASFAGMVLAHSDASAELRSRLQMADQQLQESEAKGQALADDLHAKEGIIGELERRVAQLVTSARIKHERETRARLLWEKRISSKWEAYWAVRRPKAEDVPVAETAGVQKHPETTKAVVAAAACCRSKMETTQIKSTLTKETRADRLYVWEEEGEERHEESAAVAAASTCQCARELPRATSGTHACRASTAVPNEAAASEESGAVSPHHRTRHGRPSVTASSSTRLGSESTSSASGSSSPSSPVPGSAAGANRQSAGKRVDGCDDDDHHDDNPRASHRRRTPPPREERCRHRGEKRSRHRGGRKQQCRGKSTIAAKGPHPGSVRVFSSPSRSALAVNALEPSRYRHRAEESDGRVDPVVTPGAAARDGGVAPVRHGEGSVRPRPQPSGTATSISPGQHAPEAEVGSHQHRHQHQATAQAIDDRWIGSSPSSSITPAAGRNRLSPQAAHRHQHPEHGEEEEEEPFRRAEIAHGRSEGEQIGHPAAVVEGEGRKREGQDTAFVTAADIAAAAEAVARSFALRSPPGSPSSVQEQQQLQIERQQHHDHQHHHQEQPVLSPLSSLSYTTEIRTVPRSDWRSPSGQRADVNISVPAGAAGASVSEYTSWHARGSRSDSPSSRSRSSRPRSYTTGSSIFSDQAGARHRRPETAGVSSPSGSPLFVSPASGSPQHPPQGSPNHYEGGGFRFSEPVRGSRSEPTPGQESRLTPTPTARPGAVVSRSTPRSYAFSRTSSGYRSSRSRQVSARGNSDSDSRSSAAASAENTRSTGTASSMYVSSSSGSVSVSGPASPSSLGSSSPSKAGRCRDGSGGSTGYGARKQPERSGGARREMVTPPPLPPPPPPPPQVQDRRRDDRSATSASNFLAYRANTTGSRVSSRSSLYGVKLDYLSACLPSQMMMTMGSRDGEEEGHRPAEGQRGQQELLSSPSLSPLSSSPLASPPPVPPPPEQALDQRHLLSTPPQQRHRHHQQHQHLTQQQHQQHQQQHSYLIEGARPGPLSQLAPPQRSDKRAAST